MEKLKPAVSRATLLFIAGMTWVGIGIMLNYLSCSWLTREDTAVTIAVAAAGLACALVIHRFGFSRIAKKNFERIQTMDGRRCLFAFMTWKSYILVVLMVLMGSLLRHSAIPKLYLAGVYTGIGTALILSGLCYVRYVTRILNPPGPPLHRDQAD